MTEVVFPAMSKNNQAAAGVLATWFVRQGEPVEAGQLLAEVQMDKVSGEVVAPASGVVHLLAEEEQEVIQGTVIARIDPA